MHTGNPTFADDIAIVTIHKPLLQNLLDICHAYSRKWRFQFNSRKSEIMIFGRDCCPGTELNIGGKVIHVKDTCKHMGIPLSVSSPAQTKRIEDRIDKGEKAYFAVQGLGNRRLPVTPVVSSKLYWSVCVPRMMHGLEVTDLQVCDLNKLEQAHGKMAKMIQGLPTQTPNSICIAPLGWISLEAYLDKMKLLFLWRILVLSINSIYKQVAIERICKILSGHCRLQSPISNIVETFRRYNLIDELLLAVSTGVYMPIEEFKNVVKTRVYDYDNERYKISLKMVKNVDLFSLCVPEIKWWTWWKYAFRRPDKVNNCRVLMRLIAGQSSLKAHEYRYNDAEDKSCPHCDLQQIQSVSHLLFECTHPNILHQRDKWLEKIHSILPPAMLVSIGGLGSVEKTAFILSGLGPKYVNEWEDGYTVLVDFIAYMYYTHSLLL